MRVGVEDWSAVLPELLPLFPQHWKEVLAPAPLDMCFSAYRQMEKNGSLLLVTLRSDEKLVGYWTLMITPLLHSQTLRTAQTDLLFIQRDYREGGQGFRTLWSGTREALLSRGVKLWFVGAKLAKPLGPLLEAYGFHPQEMSYLCRLGEAQ